MAGLKQIKTKIRSVEKTRKVTKAMEAVSAAKMRKAQSAAIGARAYARAATAILARVSGSQELANHPLTQAREIERALYLVITSDKGLAGALNSAVLRATLADMRSLGLPASAISVIAVGRKANDFFASRGYTIESYHPNTDEVSTAIISELVTEAASHFAGGTTDVVKIAYQNFVSTFEQRPILRTIFPLSLGELEKVVSDIIPARGVFSQAASHHYQVGNINTYTIEPSEREVLDAVVPLLASIFVYHALLESQASEHSARMVAMKSASDKAQELTHTFTLKFNKARQAAIT